MGLTWTFHEMLSMEKIWAISFIKLVPFVVLFIPIFPTEFIFTEPRVHVKFFHSFFKGPVLIFELNKSKWHSLRSILQSWPQCYRLNQSVWCDSANMSRLTKMERTGCDVQTTIQIRPENQHLREKRFTFLHKWKIPTASRKRFSRSSHLQQRCTAADITGYCYED